VTIAVDENMVFEFVTIISEHAVALAATADKPGVLQLSRLNSRDEKLIPSRFRLDDPEAIAKAAIFDAGVGHNVYIEPRSVRSDLSGAARGGLIDTEWAFALVVDADHDKGRGGAVTVRPSLTVETSPGNFHYWYLFDRPVSAKQAKAIGDAIRIATGADSDTGVVTQPYRVPGTPNYPSKKKQARGRTTVEPTRLIEWTGRLWDPDALLEAHRGPAPSAAPQGGMGGGCGVVDEASLPEGLMKAIRDGGVSNGSGANGDKSKSGLFHNVVGELKKRKWTVEAIVALLEKHPNGVAAKYNGRLREEVRRSYDKVENGSGLFILPSPAAGGGAGGGGGTGSPPPGSPPPGAAGGAGATPQGAPYVLRTIRIISGQLARAAAEAEQAMIAAGIEAFARAGALVYPYPETLGAAAGHKVEVVQLSAFDRYSLIEPLTEAAIFQHFDGRRRAWVDIDPPPTLVSMVLSRRRRWAFPRIGGVITTPTLRADGSLLDAPGYDPRTELYFKTDLKLPPIPAKPAVDDARAALAILKEPFAEFSFKNKSLDLSVAISALLTALLRGSLPTAPIVLVRADTPGVGKSYLVDTISMIATGGRCPVITALRNEEETEKRLGAILLSGSAIVSLDNLTRDLEGELLCQIAERPMVRIRVLGKSEMPLCEVHTAVFATGNNVGYAGDMVRRGLMCELEALIERPERREFQHDVVKELYVGRARYVAAALTVVRAYLETGAPRVCDALGSYSEWSRMARSPLAWLGEPDPVSSMEQAREEDPELAKIREFFVLWPSYMRMDTPYTPARIIEIACEDTPANRFSPDLTSCLLKVAAMKGRESEISLERLGWWLRRISGRIVDGHRLVKGKDSHTKNANYSLTKS
jgi:hypothetical protein